MCKKNAEGIILGTYRENYQKVNKPPRKEICSFKKSSELRSMLILANNQRLNEKKTSKRC